MSAPVLHIDAASINTSNSAINLGNIHCALIAALGIKGRNINYADQIWMTATSYKDGKIATVRTLYSQQRNSINYADSSNLGFNGNTISAEYNNWLNLIRKLNAC